MLTQKKPTEDLFIRTESEPEGEWVTVSIQLFSVQELATLFSAYVSDQDLILKYEINCDSVIHPLVKEAVLLKKVADLGISPRFYYLSPPVKFTFPPLGSKMEVLATRKKLTDCAEYQTSSVRFLAMEYAGISVYDLTMKENDQIAKKNGFNGVFPGGLPLCHAITIAKDLLAILEVLHKTGIAHGDVHPGNVVVKKVDGKIQVKLIDYGRAFFPDDPVDSQDPQVMGGKPFSNIHCLYSHWNLKGKRFGFRDDLFKAMHVLAVLLMGDSFTQYCNHLAELDLISQKPEINEGNSKLYRFKSAGNYFQPAWEISDKYPLNELPIVKGLLNEAMAMVRGLPDDKSIREAAANNMGLTIPEQNINIRDRLTKALEEIPCIVP